MDAVKQENFERILDDLTKLNRLKYQCSISTHEVIHPAILSKIEDLTKCVTSAPESITLPDVERLLKIRGSLDVISLGAMKQNGIYTTRIDPILRAKMKMLVSSIGQPSDLDPVDSLTRLREVKPPRDSIRVPYRGFAADIGQLIESKVRMVVGNVMAPPGSQRAEVQKDAANTSETDDHEASCLSDQIAVLKTRITQVEAELQTYKALLHNVELPQYTQEVI